MILTQNAIAKILNGAKQSEFRPTVQIIEASLLSKGIKLIISDGESCTQAISLCPDITRSNYNFYTNKIVNLTNYQANPINGYVCIKVYDIELIQDSEEIIGDPKALEQKVQEEVPKSIVYNFIEKKVKTETFDENEKQNPDNFYAPISALSITSSDWTIKARVIKKSNIKMFQNNRGDGKLFSCVLIDANNDQIQATFFNQAVEIFEHRIREGRVYTFSGGNVKHSNKNFFSVNDISISFERNSLINEVPDDMKIPRIKFEFVPLNSLPNLPINKTVDICVIILEIDKPIQIMTKKGVHMFKRTMTVTDFTACSIEVTLWEELALRPEFDTFDIGEKPIVCFKTLKLKDFNKLSLSSNFDSTEIFFNVQGIIEAENLQAWKLRQTRIYPSTPLSEKKNCDIKLKTTTEIKDEWDNTMNSNKTENFRLIGIIGKIPINETRNIWYESCTNGTCKKKVNKNSDGLFICDSCNVTFEKCKYRYSCSLTISDCCGHIFATAFDEIMTELLKITATEMYEQVMNMPEKAEDTLAAVFGKYVNVSVKATVAENKAGYKFIIKSFDPLDPSAISKILLSECIIKAK
ncbi:hypothetical protein SteCoe_15423 [Stentor coeruleus]|uniref:Replication protein A subunit n=1 Tax=Stentor coeruleus TaxID=5963 RepID=A0A1R2C3M9_9CILI|nr:hypothetical protein SteCoe_15423 [Stentor coeruleus]